MSALWPVQDVVCWLLASYPNRSVSWWVMGCLPPFSDSVPGVILSLLLSYDHLFFTVYTFLIVSLHSLLSFHCLLMHLTTLYQLLSLFDVTATACIPWSHSWFHGNLWVIISNKQLRVNNFPCIECGVSVAGCHSTPHNTLGLMVISTKYNAALEHLIVLIGVIFLYAIGL